MNCSGITTVTKSDSPRGSRHTSSSSACILPSSVERISSLGSSWAKSHQRGRIPGSVCLPGASRALIGPSWLIVRAYQSAPSVATSSDSTQSSTLFVGVARGPHGADTDAQTPAEAPVMTVDADEQQDEQRDRDDHEPGALGELRPDDDHGDDPGRHRAQ